MLGAFETTYLPGLDVDVAETTGHDRRWRDDLQRLADLGITGLRLALRWQRAEPEPGTYRFEEIDEVLQHCRDLGLSPAVDLVHHTSYPRWLADGFADPRWGDAYLAWIETVFRRHPDIPAYTLFNEPFATLFLAGHQGLWPPYLHGLSGLLRLYENVLPPLAQAAHLARELVPDAVHLWVDTCEGHEGAAGHEDEARFCDDRRHIALDLVLAHDLDDGSRPFLRRLIDSGGQRLMELLAPHTPAPVDVLGLDYYCHSEWWYEDAGPRAPSPQPRGFARLAAEYSARYDLPVALTETNVRGFPSDRATWLRYVLEQYEQAVAAGVPLTGFCWFPSVDSADWDSLLARGAGHIDPVGTWSLEPDGQRRATSVTRSLHAVVGGAAATSLPAYRLQEPAASDLSGHLPLMQVDRWIDPPPDEPVPPPLVVPLPPGVPAASDHRPRSLEHR